MAGRRPAAALDGGAVADGDGRRALQRELGATVSAIRQLLDLPGRQKPRQDHDYQSPLPPDENAWATPSPAGHAYQSPPSSDGNGGASPPSEEDPNPRNAVLCTVARVFQAGCEHALDTHCQAPLGQSPGKVERSIVSTAVEAELRRGSVNWQTAAIKSVEAALRTIFSTGYYCAQAVDSTDEEGLDRKLEEGQLAKAVRAVWTDGTGTPLSPTDEKEIACLVEGLVESTLTMQQLLVTVSEKYWTQAAWDVFQPGARGGDATTAFELACSYFTGGVAFPGDTLWTTCLNDGVLPWMPVRWMVRRILYEAVPIVASTISKGELAQYSFDPARPEQKTGRDDLLRRSRGAVAALPFSGDLTGLLDAVRSAAESVKMAPWLLLWDHNARVADTFFAGPKAWKDNARKHTFAFEPAKHVPFGWVGPEGNALRHLRRIGKPTLNARFEANDTRSWRTHQYFGSKDDDNKAVKIFHHGLDMRATVSVFSRGQENGRNCAYQVAYEPVAVGLKIDDRVHHSFDVNAYSRGLWPSVPVLLRTRVYGIVVFEAEDTTDSSPEDTGATATPAPPAADEDSDQDSEELPPSGLDRSSAAPKFQPASLAGPPPATRPSSITRRDGHQEQSASSAEPGAQDTTSASGFLRLNNASREVALGWLGRMAELLPSTPERANILSLWMSLDTDEVGAAVSNVDSDSFDKTLDLFQEATRGHLLNRRQMAVLSQDGALLETIDKARALFPSSSMKASDLEKYLSFLESIVENWGPLTQSSAEAPLFKTAYRSPPVGGTEQAIEPPKKRRIVPVAVGRPMVVPVLEELRRVRQDMKTAMLRSQEPEDVQTYLKARFAPLAPFEKGGDLIYGDVDAASIDALRRLLVDVKVELERMTTNTAAEGGAPTPQKESTEDVAAGPTGQKTVRKAPAGSKQRYLDEEDRKRVARYARNLRTAVESGSLSAKFAERVRGQLEAFDRAVPSDENAVPWSFFAPMYQLNKAVGNIRKGTWDPALPSGKVVILTYPEWVAYTVFVHGHPTSRLTKTEQAALNDLSEDLVRAVAADDIALPEELFQLRWKLEQKRTDAYQKRSVPAKKKKDPNEQGARAAPIEAKKLPVSRIAELLGGVAKDKVAQPFTPEAAWLTGADELRSRNTSVQRLFQKVARHYATYLEQSRDEPEQRLLFKAVFDARCALLKAQALHLIKTCTVYDRSAAKNKPPATLLDTLHRLGGVHSVLKVIRSTKISPSHVNNDGKTVRERFMPFILEQEAMGQGSATAMATASANGSLPMDGVDADDEVMSVSGSSSEEEEHDDDVVIVGQNPTGGSVPIVATAQMESVDERAVVDFVQTTRGQLFERRAAAVVDQDDALVAAVDRALGMRVTSSGVGLDAYRAALDHINVTWGPPAEPTLVRPLVRSTGTLAKERRLEAPLPQPEPTTAEEPATVFRARLRRALRPLAKKAAEWVALTSAAFERAMLKKDLAYQQETEALQQVLVAAIKAADMDKDDDDDDEDVGEDRVKSGLYIQAAEAIPNVDDHTKKTAGVGLVENLSLYQESRKARWDAIFDQVGLDDTLEPSDDEFFHASFAVRLSSVPFAVFLVQALQMEYDRLMATAGPAIATAVDFATPLFKRLYLYPDDARTTAQLKTFVRLSNSDIVKMGELERAIRARDPELRGWDHFLHLELTTFRQLLALPASLLQTLIRIYQTDGDMENEGHFDSYAEYLAELPRVPPYSEHDAFLRLSDEQKRIQIEKQPPKTTSLETSKPDDDEDDDDEEDDGGLPRDAGDTGVSAPLFTQGTLRHRVLSLIWEKTRRQQVFDAHFREFGLRLSWDELHPPVLPMDTAVRQKAVSFVPGGRVKLRDKVYTVPQPLRLEDPPRRLYAEHPVLWARKVITTDSVSAWTSLGRVPGVWFYGNDPTYDKSWSEKMFDLTSVIRVSLDESAAASDESAATIRQSLNACNELIDIARGLEQSLPVDDAEGTKSRQQKAARKAANRALYRAKQAAEASLAEVCDTFRDFEAEITKGRPLTLATTVPLCNAWHQVYRGMLTSLPYSRGGTTLWFMDESESQDAAAPWHGMVFSDDGSANVRLVAQYNDQIQHCDVYLVATQVRWRWTGGRC
jgi:hypothetical protein